MMICRYVDPDSARTRITEGIEMDPMLYALLAAPDKIPVSEIALTITQWFKLAGIAASAATVFAGTVGWLAWVRKVRPAMDARYVTRDECAADRRPLLERDASLAAQLAKHSADMGRLTDKMDEAIGALRELYGRFEGVMSVQQQPQRRRRKTGGEE